MGKLPRWPSADFALENAIGFQACVPKAEPAKTFFKHLMHMQNSFRGLSNKDNIIKSKCNNIQMSDSDFL